MSLTYKTATEADIPAIYDFCKKLIDTFEDVTAIDYEAVLQWVRKKLTQNILNYTCVYRDGEKVAYFSCQLQGDEWELDDLYVLPAYRNQGIGTKIVSRCIRDAHKPVFLYVFRENEGAIRFYQRMGFAVSQKVGKTRLIMRRAVDSA